MATSAAPTDPRTRPRRRWVFRLAVLAIVLVVLFLFRAQILYGLASLLIVENPGFSADHLLLLSGDRAIQRAAQIHAEQGGRILLVEWKPSRLVSCGVMKSPLAIEQRELRRRGVPSDAMEVLPGIAVSDWDVARQVRDWLQERPDARIMLLCDRLESRRISFIFGRILGSEVKRVGFLALPAREFDETNWWRHKPGLLDVFNCSARLAFCWVAEEGEKEPDWDVDAYEGSLK